MRTQAEFTVGLACVPALQIGFAIVHILTGDLMAANIVLITMLISFAIFGNWIPLVLAIKSLLSTRRKGSDASVRADIRAPVH